MNGGAPATALRALRVAPVLVDDLAIEQQLSRARLASDDRIVSALPDSDTLRWTRAWLVSWQAELHSRAIIGQTYPWHVVVPRAEWPTLKGDPDQRRRDAALELLIRTELVAPQAIGSDPLRPRAHPAFGYADVQAVSLTERAFVEHRAGLELDWGTAFQACRAEPAALLTLRALVDCLPALDDPGPVTLRELAERTGYGEKQVRVALRRLVKADVLATHDAPGQPTRYRMTDRLLGRRAGGLSERGVRVLERSSSRDAAGMEAVARPTLQRTPTPAIPTQDAPVSSAERSQTPAFRLTLNGATLSLPAGLTANVEFDIDGVPHLRISADRRA